MNASEGAIEWDRGGQAVWPEYPRVLLRRDIALARPLQDVELTER